MAVETISLTHTYAVGTAFEFTAIKGVTFKTLAHEFIGIIGHTGSGKSTLIQHLNKLLTPTSGSVIVNGFDLSDKKMPMKEIVKRVGIVFQYPEYQLFEETVYKDIAFGPTNLGFSKSETDFLVREAMDFVSLDFEKLKDESPFDLSGGQKRRVAIAGVLAMKPQILVLDEPASGLDPVGREGILRSIRRMNKEIGISIFLVSHNMDDVAEYCDRVMVFSKGELLLFESPNEVFAHADLLESIGLEVPQAKKVLLMLKERGFSVDASFYTCDEAVAEIARCLRQAKPC
ncbi:MAG: energy-coupling factor transporter ATPase [Eubacteriaceae bacterium]|nr:energy-coupling factor transporter ATPase [Eubacteriaceae bacterium]